MRIQNISFFQKYEVKNQKKIYRIIYVSQNISKVGRAFGKEKNAVDL